MYCGFAWKVLRIELYLDNASSPLPGTPSASDGANRPNDLRQGFKKLRVGRSRWNPKAGLTWLIFVLVAALTASSVGLYAFRDEIWGTRAEARAAVQSLRDGDLKTLQEHLSEQRGHRDFAYFFAAEVTPRDLGDALATVADATQSEYLNGDLESPEYDLLLTDLAGALGLATHGTGNRALPDSWTTDFILATTTPELLYGEQLGEAENHSTHRVDQDAANMSNLLLLLSRGYWSLDFLRSVTTEYYEFVLADGGAAWPKGDPIEKGLLAPAPNGVYLFDGFLALSAALTTNPSASEWAFSEFLPGVAEISGTDYEVGRFTHFLMFEYQFAEEVPGESKGYGVALTALAAAVASVNLALQSSEGSGLREAPENGVGPAQDSQIVQALALEFEKKQARVCSINPLHWGTCIVMMAETIWDFVMRWGHRVLEILSFASVLPFPFGMIGVAAAATNAIWYAIDEDYAMAGLSLATAVPGLAYRNIATWAKAGASNGVSKTSSALSEQRARTSTAAKWWRFLPAYQDCGLAQLSGGIAINYGAGWNREQLREANKKARALNEAAGRGELIKTQVNRSSQSASVTYQKETGKKVPRGSQVDHTIELQLGGKDDKTNMKPLDASVNASFGTQIRYQISNRDFGDTIPAFAICGKK